MSMVRVRPWPPGKSAVSRQPWWQSLTTIPRRWMAALFTACAAYAGGVALFTSNHLHLLWGTSAAVGYLLAAVAVLAWKSRGLDLALGLAMGGGLLFPLGWLAATGTQQPEVSVIIRSAQLLIHHGTPYQSTAALAAAHLPYDYDPYLPVMTLFGIPRALAAGMITDPRIWFGAAFIAAFGLALAFGGATEWIRWTVLITASPIIALELAVGGTDIPVLALMCLGLALLWPTLPGPGARGHASRPVLAGVILGVGAAMKATAWPLLIIVVALLAARDGKRAVVTFTVSALAVCAVLIGPVLAVWPGALVVNTISYPLGLTKSPSPAASPLPGHALAQTGDVGHLIAVALLLLAGLAIAVSLVVRPPRDVPAATWRLIIGLALMFLLAPATRFGYFVYPLGLLAWLLATVAGRHAAQRAAEPAAGGRAPPG
jgi:Glycosyltransferase family 87